MAQRHGRSEFQVLRPLTFEECKWNDRFAAADRSSRIVRQSRMQDPPRRAPMSPSAPTMRPWP